MAMQRSKALKFPVIDVICEVIFMEYCIAIVFNDQLIQVKVPEGKKTVIASTSSADTFVPNLGHNIEILVKSGAIDVSDTAIDGATQTYSMKLDTPHVVDEARRIALCVSEELSCESVAWLGEEFSLSLGRGEKRKDGIKNDINLPAQKFVSRSQSEITRENGITTIKDLGSANGTFVNSVRVKSAELHRGDVISILSVSILYEEEYLRFENAKTEPELSESLRSNQRTEDSESELFKRSPRIQEQVPVGKIEIPAPPASIRKPEINWLSTLLPAGVTIAIAVTMALAFQNTMMMLYSLPMTVAGVAVSIANYLRGGKQYKLSSEERKTAYLEKLDDIKTEVGKKREAQKRAMLLADPSPNECLADVKYRNTKLWCREPDDADFASVRLGIGTVPFSVRLEYPKEQLLEEDELKKLPGEIYRSNNSIEKMPVLCDIRSSGIVGLIGTPELTNRQIQNMILHLTTHHCYTELKLVCLYNEKDQETLSWLADLPHTHGASRDEVFLASSQEEADALFHSFTELFKQRKREKEENSSYGSDPLFTPYVLFVFLEPKLLKKTDPINKYLFMERGLGAGCLMAAQEIAQLPKQCTQIVTLSGKTGDIYNTASASERQTFQPDEISPALLREFGKWMRPLYCDEGITVSSLPKSYTFYQMLGVNSMTEYDIGKHWKASDLLDSKLAPSAPFGILENGEQILFNSPPTGENGGAHALLAGTTGSGKSEVLLTIILSLALRYSPEDIGFLFIDYKGSGTADRLAGLPHLRGVITNPVGDVDEETLRRSLASIEAESNKRMRLFKEYNADHPQEKKTISAIWDYTEKYHQGKVNEALPHLFIVVDEFGEMRKKLPDIMDQFLSVAQIGRSLGVHLVLAMQSLSGVVDSKIRANILKQLCLKVANSAESRDMIDTDLAARIKEPGRGYMKIDDSLQIFQSAYGSGKIILPDGSESSQLSEALEAISTYCREHGIRKLPDIFCPPLPTHTVFSLPHSEQESPRPFGNLPIGLRDDPATQFMGEYSLDVFSRNTLIVGSQLMGKTNLLQTILRGAAEIYSPEEVNIYILEFASLFLKNYESLPHVGGVATISETEKITNLFRMLNEQIADRRKKFMERGVSSFSAYRESKAHDLPQVLLLVDDLAAAKEYFSPDNDPLLAVCKEGLSLGISVVATATQPVGTTTYLPLFANRIALYNNDATVYNTLLGHTSLRPKELPGRCLVTWDNAVYECQSYLAFDGKREIDRTEAICRFCQEQTNSANGKHAAPVPFIPKDLTAEGAYTAYPEAYKDGRVMFGLDYSTVKPLPVKLAALGVLGVSGRKKDVQNFQRYLLTSAEKNAGVQAEFYVVDDIARELQPVSGFSCITAYSFLPEQAKQMLLQVQKKAEERYARVAGGDVSVLDTSPTLVLMLNSGEAINAISADKTALAAWRALTGTLKSMNVCIVFGNLDNASIPYSSEVLKKLKDDRKLVFFDDLGNLKIGDLPYATIKQFAGTFQAGDGYVILGNDTARIRVPNCPSPKIG